MEIKNHKARNTSDEPMHKAKDISHMLDSEFPFSAQVGTDLSNFLKSK